MLRLLCQNLAIKLLGLLQPTALMMPQGKIERLLNGELSHERLRLIQIIA
jgi:hypothetical protein